MNSGRILVVLSCFLVAALSTFTSEGACRECDYSGGVWFNYSPIECGGTICYQKRVYYVFGSCTAGGFLNDCDLSGLGDNGFTIISACRDGACVAVGGPTSNYGSDGCNDVWALCW